MCFNYLWGFFPLLSRQDEMVTGAADSPEGDASDRCGAAGAIPGTARTEPGTAGAEPGTACIFPDGH